ncbi:MAG: carbohydrate ABC transporter permease [Candidatus Fimadaptatus sp.]
MRKYRRTAGSMAFDVFNHLFMILIMLIMIYPLMNVLAISMSSKAYIDAGEVTWFPRGFNVVGYQYMLRDSELINSYGWTIAYALGGTFLTLLFTSMAAYPLAQSGFVFKRGFTVFLSVTMFVNGGMIPTFILLKQLKLFNTYWVMVLPGCVSAYNTFVFRSFFQGIPSSLRESAYVDGASDVRIWLQIILPLSKPLLATFFLFTMVGHWNSWFNALLYLTDKNRYPLQMVLRRLVVQDDLGGMYATDSAAGIYATSFGMHTKNAQMAAVVLAMAPILAVYPFIQKYFAKGVMIGAIKG